MPSPLTVGVSMMLPKLSWRAQSHQCLHHTSSVSHTETLFCSLHKSVSSHSTCGHQRVPQSPSCASGTPPLTILCRTRGFTLTRESWQECSHSPPGPVTLRVMRLPQVFVKPTLKHLTAASFPPAAVMGTACIRAETSRCQVDVLSERACPGPMAV